VKLSQVLAALPNRQSNIILSTDRWPTILDIRDSGSVEAFMPTVLQTPSHIGYFDYEIEHYNTEDDSPEKILLKVTRKSKKIKWEEYQAMTRLSNDATKKRSYIDGLSEDEFPTIVMERKYFITTPGQNVTVNYQTHTALINTFPNIQPNYSLNIVRVSDAVWEMNGPSNTANTKYFDLVMSMKDHAQEIKACLMEEFDVYERTWSEAIRVGNSSLQNYDSENILDYICLINGTYPGGWFTLDIPCTITLKKLANQHGYESEQVLKPGLYEVYGDFREYLIDWPYEDKRIRGLSTNLRKTSRVMHDDNFLSRL